MNRERELLGTISIYGADIDNLPMWSINRYSEEFCNNYIKIMTVRRICKLMHEGASDMNFFVAKKSETLFPSELNEVFFSHDYGKYIRLATKGDNPDEFWRIIRDYIRPVVFYTGGNNPQKLVDYKDETAIKIKNLSYNSPPSWDIQGSINGLLDLANVKNKREMEEETHISNQIANAIENTERYVRTAQIVNDPMTPEGVKKYANVLLDDLMSKQGKLNEKLGVRIKRIEVNV